MDMGQKIKTLREQNDMTLEELGNKVGVGKSTVRKWENGMIANMRRDKIAKLADALGCSPAYLMGWEEEEKVATNLRVVSDSPELDHLIEIVKNMPEDNLKRVIEYAEFIKAKKEGR